MLINKAVPENTKKKKCTSYGVNGFDGKLFVNVYTRAR